MNNIDKQKEAERKQKIRETKMAENPTETLWNGQKWLRKSREQKKKENPTEMLQKERKRLQKRREQKMKENPTVTHENEAKRKQKSRKKKMAENPTETLQNEAERRRMSTKKIKELENEEYFRLFLFLDNVRDGPIFPCVCCNCIKFRNYVKIYNDAVKNEILIKSMKPNIINEAIGDPCVELQVESSSNKDAEFYICLYCLL